MLVDFDDDRELAFALRLADMYGELTRRLADGGRVDPTFRGRLEQVTRDARLELAEAEACGIVRVTPTAHGTLVIDILKRQVH